MVKIRPVRSGNTIYEIDRYTHKPKHIIHGVDKYFKMRAEEEAKRKSEDEQELEYYEEIYDDEPESFISPSERRKQLLALVGNKKKRVITNKADGLSKEIAIDETEYEPSKKKDVLYRKKKAVKTKPKRKIIKKKGCRCK